MNAQVDIDFLKPDQNHEIAQHVVSILQGIRFGSIEIVVHDGHDVQIDGHDKFRIKSPQSAN